MSFVKICNYVKTVITFERDKSIILIEAFQDCYISFNEDNLHSLLFITSALGASFSSLLRRPLVFERWGYTKANDFLHFVVILTYFYFQTRTTEARDEK